MRGTPAVGIAAVARVALLAVVAPSGCTVQGEFHCTADDDCVFHGTPGRCEATSYCSFPDPACATGHRYGEHAGGEYAERCVGDAPDGDATVSDGGSEGVSPPSDGVVATCGLEVVAGAYSNHACARVSDGTVWCWGENADGQLGQGARGGIRARPVKVKRLREAVQVAAGAVHSCALVSDGAVYCWGANAEGQLGDGTFTARTEPVRVVGLDGVVEIASAGRHTCARLGEGTVRCWGENSGGQLGIEPGDDRAEPILVPGLADAVELAAGVSFTCARRVDRTVVCWGVNAEGELGDGTAQPRIGPVTVAGLADAVAIAAGDDHACAARADGRVVCWGDGEFGQLGDHGTFDRSAPVVAPDIVDAMDVAAGDETSCALGADGKVHCWGRNHAGQLGGGTTSGYESLPVQVAGGLTFVQSTLGARHACGRASSGAIYCWGANADGQLGDGTQSERLLPTPVALTCP